MKCQVGCWRSVLVILFAAALCQTAAAGTLEDGLSAYDRGDYASAIAHWRPLAEQGDGDAQQALGLLYDLGYGVTQDFATAISWYRRAADGGNKIGQFRLAFMYEYGLGLARDGVQAASWYRKAAEQGMTAAQTELAFMYLQGMGVTRDYDQALTWIEKAAPAGDQYIAEFLFEMYSTGKGVAKNDQAAEKWSNKIVFHPIFSAGTETLAPISDQQLTDIVQRIEAGAGRGYANYRRYYAAVSPRKPTPLSISPNRKEYYALMIDVGAARVSVRAIYLAPEVWHFVRSDASQVSIVSEHALPLVADGGCRVVTVVYDIARQIALPPRCNGVG